MISWPGDRYVKDSNLPKSGGGVDEGRHVEGAGNSAWKATTLIDGKVLLPEGLRASGLTMVAKIQDPSLGDGVDGGRPRRGGGASSHSAANARKATTLGAKRVKVDVGRVERGYESKVVARSHDSVSVCDNLQHGF